MTNPDPGDVDAEVELSRLIERAERATGRPFDGSTLDLLPPTWEHRYWRTVIQGRPGATASPRALFEAGGLTLPPAETMDDDQLTLQLWRLIRRMERVNIFLTSTDHLSDRQLYTWLRDTGLTKFVMTAPGSTSGYTGLDVIGGGSDEDFEIWARYYMDEAEREHWIEEHPEDELPESKPRPFERDRFLPRFSPYFAGGEDFDDMSWMDDDEDGDDPDEDEPGEGDEWKR